jgi:hypothetical protein
LLICEYARFALIYVNLQVIGANDRMPEGEFNLTAGDCVGLYRYTPPGTKPE